MSHFIRWEEIVDPHDYVKAPVAHQANLQLLYTLICKLRHRSGIPFVMRTPEHRDRGYRTSAQHYDLYMRIARKQNLALAQIKMPTRSLHLVGAAIDIADAEGRLKEWIRRNEDYCFKTLDVHFENFNKTPGWVHMQPYAPLSGKHYFDP